MPDWLIRIGIRRLLARRLRDEDQGSPQAQNAHEKALVETLSGGPLAVDTRSANEQHYEVPTEFFQHILGKHMKYSCGLWSEDGLLDLSEERMLELTCERAELSDGQRILELGCGWGSLSLWMAQRYPKSRITAVSNSRSQRAFIDGQAIQRGCKNLEVVTADINFFEASGTYDRVVSVEMFEHLRNHELLFSRIASWLKPGGKLFAHVFTHRQFTYLFEVKDASDWMSRHFFSGGMMPSQAYLTRFQRDLQLEKQWTVEGTHYQRTAEAWLARMDQNREKLTPVLEAVYGKSRVRQWRAYWRVFFMSCAELWGYRNGTEWLVSHYRFRKP